MLIFETGEGYKQKHLIDDMGRAMTGSYLRISNAHFTKCLRRALRNGPRIILPFHRLNVYVL